MDKKKLPAKKEVGGAGAGSSKKAEEALKDGEARYRFVMDQLPGTMWTVDRSLVFTLSQGAGLKALGLQPDQVVGMSLFEFFGTNDPQHTAIASHIKALGGQEVTYEYKHQGAFFQTHLTPFYGAGEQPVGVAGIAFDITERKQAEEALVESEEKYRILVENANDIVYSLTFDGVFTYVSPTWTRILGHDISEVENRPFQIFMHPEDLSRAIEFLERTIKTGEKQAGIEYRVLHKDGNWRWHTTNASPIHDADGKVVAFMGIARDITERKQSEDVVRESERRFKSIIEHIHDVFFMQNSNRELLYISPQAEQVLGYTAEEVRNNWQNYMTDNPLNLAGYEKTTRAFTTGEKQEPYLQEFMHRNGTNRLVEINESPLKNDQGEVIGIVGAIRDITERKRSESALKESEEKYRLVVENAREAIFVDAGGIFKFANSQATILTGYSQEELTSRPYAEFIHPDDRQLVAERGDRRMAGLEAPVPYTFRAIVKSGDTRWVELSAVPITWEGKPATLNFLTDVTDRKRLEEEQQRVDKLEAVGLLAGGIAHDFNNILTSILGNISLARTEAAPGSELHESLEQAEKASQRARALTVQLLTFSKGGAPVKKLASLTEMLKDTAGFALSGANVKCKFSIPAGLWHAEIDAGQVSQVIHNLVINAQQAMPAGGSIEISAKNMALNEMQSPGRGLPLETGDYVRIAVTDHGIGIPKDHLEKIFDPFFNTKQKGNGMGLAVSFSIARQHGGHLSVESELGSGSTFYLYLPASKQTSAPKVDNKEAIKPAGKARILVMDDEKGVREIAGRLLKHIGYQDIEFAEDGAEAIKLYKAAMKEGKPFSVAILDLTIAGGMGGEVAIKKLLKIDPGVKAIVSSGYIDDPVIAKFRDHGFSGVVAKPYSIAELRKAVQDVIG